MPLAPLLLLRIGLLFNPIPIHYKYIRNLLISCLCTFCGKIQLSIDGEFPIGLYGALKCFPSLTIR